MYPSSFVADMLAPDVFVTYVAGDGGGEDKLVENKRRLRATLGAARAMIGIANPGVIVVRSSYQLDPRNGTRRLFLICVERSV